MTQLEKALMPSGIRVRHTRKQNLSFVLWIALGVLSISLLVHFLIEPTEAEAQYGYTQGSTPLEVSARSFCDQVARDWEGKERPLSIVKVCGV